MLRSHKHLLILLLLLLDACACALSWGAAYLLRQYILVIKLSPLLSFDLYILMIVLISLIWFLFTYIFGEYRLSFIPRFRETAFSAVKISFMSVVFGGFVLYSFKGYLFSRSFLLLFIFIHFWAFSASRALFWLAVKKALSKEANMRHVVLTGDYDTVLKLAAVYLAQAERGLKLVGVFSPAAAQAEGQAALLPDGVRDLGPTEGLEKCIQDTIIDEVCICVKEFNVNAYREFIGKCYELGIEVKIYIEELSNFTSELRVEQLEQAQMLDILHSPLSSSMVMQKKLFDIFFTTLLSLALLLPSLIIALLILILDGRPIFHRQVRCGYHGRRFLMFKFRTMKVGAEREAAELAERNIVVGGPAFKVLDDPRVTPLGRLLRRYYLDEIPQLLNVIRGEMSLVGPRPPVPEETSRYEGVYFKRMSFKPGLTGLWQVSGGHDLEFSEWVKLDLEYLHTWSLWLDFKIIFKTALVMVAGKGI